MHANNVWCCSWVSHVLSQFLSLSAVWTSEKSRKGWAQGVQSTVLPASVLYKSLCHPLKSAAVETGNITILCSIVLGRYLDRMTFQCLFQSMTCLSCCSWWQGLLCSTGTRLKTWRRRNCTDRATSLFAASLMCFSDSSGVASSL